MRLTRRDLGLGLVGAAIAPQASAATDASRALTRYLDAEFEAELQMSPERLSWLGRRDRQGELDDRSEAAADHALAWRRRSVRRMQARFRGAVLTPEAQTSYDIWELELERAEQARAWRSHEYVAARGGAHAGLPNFLINAHAVDTRADAEAYIARIRALGPALDQTLARARASGAAGVRAPRFAYEQTLREVARLTAGAPFEGGPDSALFADFKAKVAVLQAKGGVTAREAESLTRRAGAAITEDMAPAYRRFAAWIEADMAHTPTAPSGVGSLPNGEAYYKAQLFLETTTRMTPAEIHDLGLREVGRLHGEMEALKDKIGFTGPLRDFFVFMRTDPRFYVPNTEAGRAKYLRQADGYLSAIRTKLPAYFGRLPKAGLVVKRVEAFREEPGGAAHYMPGARDGSRPGTFYAHLSDTQATPTYELEGTAYHEGLPGHHMQISIAQELEGLPVFRTQYGYGAYAEGWGLYSEILAKEMGQYQDPYSDFGRLSRELWRAIRLVVDTGLHAKGWSEAETLAYYTANSPQPEAKIRSEVRRYLITPGQATSYKVGMVRIQALRREAEAALTARFDLRGFHDMLLDGGSLPLQVLEARARRWVAAQG